LKLILPFSKRDEKNEVCLVNSREEKVINEKKYHLLQTGWRQWKLKGAFSFGSKGKHAIGRTI
jgi:hypothetical protein